MPKPARREARYAARYPLRLFWDRRTYVAMSEDVSLRGLRIRTDAIPPLRLLVRVEIQLPGSGTTSMHAMVAHTTLEPGCCQPTVGLALYGISEQQKTGWEAFVRHVRDVGASSGPGTPSHVIAIQPQESTGLARLRAHAVEGNPVFCRTGLRLPVGASVHAAVVHPSNLRLHLIAGRVQDLLEQDGDVGIVLGLRTLDGPGRRGFDAFIDPQRNPARSQNETRAAS